MEEPLKKAVSIIVRVAEPDKIILFGSHANGMAKADSDYDLLVLKKGIKESRRLAQKIYLNLKNIGAPIDILVTDLDKYEILKDDIYMIYNEVDKNGKVIYEKYR